MRALSPRVRRGTLAGIHANMVVDPEQHRRPEQQSARGPLPDADSTATPRPVAVPFVSKPQGEPARTKAVRRREGSARVTWARWANWVVGISAGVFLLIALGGYLYHRGQLAEIAAEHLRLMVTGPARISIGVAQRYTARASTVTGDPVPAQVEFALYGPDGQQLMAHKEAADELGMVHVTVEADSQWPPQVRMEVVGSYSARTERAETQLAVEPTGYLTALCLDQPCYRPGETLRYRSLTVSRFSLAADRQLPIRFEVRAPNGSLVADSVREGITAKSVGWGEFPIPKDLPEGRYTVHAISLDHEFPLVRRQFVIAADHPPRLKLDVEFRVSFRPEGGELVAGMENRVSFSARNGPGKPVTVSGAMVDGQDRAVAAVETTHEGMGSLQFEPQAAQQYRLEVDQPSAGQAEIKLPPVSGNHSAVLTTGLGVIEPGAPLEFNVRATAADLPLLAVVACRGIEVGQQALVTSLGANTVTVPLHEDAAGALRLTLYEYRSNPPKLLAERLIYRRPRKRFEVQAALEGRSLRPGQSIDLPLRVTDEQGRPALADLSIAVFDEALCPQAAMPPGSAMSQLLLLGELESPQTIENVESYLSADSKMPTALDLLLGACARRQAVAAESSAGASAPAGGSAAAAEAGLGCPPPMMFDNLHQLIERYQASLVSYRVNRTRVLNALTTLSFFGGIGLVVFVAMLSLLNIPCGLRLWGPALGVAAACIVIGAVLMDPERLKRHPGGDVPFTSCEAPPTSRPSPPREIAGAAARRQNLSTFPASADDIRKEPGSTAVDGRSLGSLVWRPLVSTDQQGRTSVRVELPARPASWRILLDAYSESGRIGASSIPISRIEGPSDPACPVRLSAKLGQAKAKIGQTVSLEVQLVNATDRGLPMTVAIVGLPAGMEVRLERLEALRRSGELDAYQVRAGELVCTWRSFAPKRTAIVQLDLAAVIPGKFTAPASRTYLNDAPERKHWVEPLAIEITRE